MLLQKLNYETNKETDDTIVAKKDGVSYCITIKHYSGRYASRADIEEYINNKPYTDKDLFFVLVIDSTYETKEIKMLLQNEHIAVIDKSSLKEMIAGKDVIHEVCSWTFN